MYRSLCRNEVRVYNYIYVNWGRLNIVLMLRFFLGLYRIRLLSLLSFCGVKVNWTELAEFGCEITSGNLNLKMTQYSNSR